MSKTPDKPQPERPEKAEQALHSGGRPSDADATKKPPRPVREGKDNLRQRAEWFRRRSGGED